MSEQRFSLFIQPVFNHQYTCLRDFSLTRRKVRSVHVFSANADVALSVCGRLMRVSEYNSENRACLLLYFPSSSIPYSSTVFRWSGQFLGLIILKIDLKQIWYYGLRLPFHSLGKLAAPPKTHLRFSTPPATPSTSPAIEKYPPSKKRIPSWHIANHHLRPEARSSRTASSSTRTAFSTSRKHPAI